MPADDKNPQRIKVMKVSPKKEVNKENKVSEQPIVNFSENELPTLQPKSAKSESKEIRVKCPHCSKELYIKRDTEQCIYCKEPISKDLVVGLFLRSEELERQKIKKQQLQEQQQLQQQQLQQQQLQQQQLQQYKQSKQAPKKKSNGNIVFLFVLLTLSVPLYIYNGTLSDSDYSSQYTKNELSSSELNSLNVGLLAISTELVKSGMSYQILDKEGNVAIKIDSTSDYGKVLKSILGKTDQGSIDLWYITKASYDHIANLTSNYVGIDIKFIFIFDSDFSNVIYTVVGDHNSTT